MIKGDFLKENIFKKILKEIDKNKKKVVVISNLPYKTAVPILVKILENRNFFQELILMFQKEVADRILAKKNTKSYGRISIFSQWLCKIEKKLNLTPNYFFPKPKVDSTILKFTFKKKIKEVKNEKLLIKLIKICFNQRRKTIKNNLKRINLFSNEFLIDCKINPNKRAEELDFTDFVKLSNYLNKKKFIKI
tara:strand:- start:380 stop:955 length:576 start_codon:yes stop_codon:yes gene_type:complete